MKALLDRLKSRTYWLGFFVIGLSYAEQNFPLIRGYLGEYAGLVEFSIGLAIMGCREITTKPISKKTDPKDSPFVH